MPKPAISTLLSLLLVATLAGCSVQGREPARDQVNAPNITTGALTPPSAKARAANERKLARRHAPLRLACLAGYVPILLETGDDKCVRPCTSDADCETSTACLGRGVLDENGAKGSPTDYCLAR